jgi:multiple sugar transport system ATP-binding protein
MNFLSGRIDGADPLRFQHGTFGLDLPGAAAAKLQTVKGKPVTLGVRPEDITLTGIGGFKAGVEVTEQMGNEVILYLRLGEDALVARVPPHNAPRPGEGVSITFDTERIHFFDSDTELALV